jgi:hypothetical protein
MHQESVKLALELRAEGAALSGSIVDERGTEQAFTGWLGLLTVLEAARVRVEQPAGAGA